MPCSAASFRAIGDARTPPSAPVRASTPVRAEPVEAPGRQWDGWPAGLSGPCSGEGARALRGRGCDHQHLRRNLLTQLAYDRKYLPHRDHVALSGHLPE